MRLLRLVSPALPVGGFHFSQGLEAAVQAGWVRDAVTAQVWIAGIARHGIATLDLPHLLHMHRAWMAADAGEVATCSEGLLAARETMELRAEDRAMGRALARLLASLGMGEAEPWREAPHASWAALFALACARHQLDAGTCARAYLWAWCENQVLAAIKCVPLGQTAGQRILDALIGQIPGLAGGAQKRPVEEAAISTVLQAIASCAHETQYSRLFLS